MSDQRIINLIEETLRIKKQESINQIKYNFYELRVKYNLSEQDTFRFLELARNKLQNEGYKVSCAGAKIENELLIAIKSQ